MSADIGDTAPDFTMPTDGGGTVSLAALRGRPVVLYFYPKDDTPGCTKEACGFRDLHEDIRFRGAEVFGISADSVADHGRFAAKFDLPFVLLADEDHTVIKAYQAWGEKQMIGKTYEGILRSTVVIGPDGVVARHWTKVAAAAEHPAEVLAFLDGSA